MDNFVADLSHGNSVRHTYSSFVLFLEDNIRRLLVDTDTKTFKFSLDDSLVSQRLVDIEHDKNKMACLSNSYNLATSTFAIFGSLNDTGKIEHLDSCTVVLHLTGYSGQGRELICSS